MSKNLYHSNEVVRVLGFCNVNIKARKSKSVYEKNKEIKIKKINCVYKAVISQHTMMKSKYKWGSQVRKQNADVQVGGKVYFFQNLCITASQKAVITLCANLL